MNFSLESDQVVQLPVAENFSQFLTQFTFPDFTQLTNPEIYKVALVLAIVASLETLLCVEATDKIDPFKEDDMVFIGENLPHVWLNDETYYNGQQNHKAKAIVVYFNKNLFGSDFYELDETSNIKALFEKAKIGIKIGDETRKKIGAKLEKMLAQKDFERVIGLFEVLHLISTAKDNELITTEGYTKPVSKDGADRLASVYKYVHENFKQPISLNQVAELANLTPQSFCRLFKKRNKKKFVEYLNDMRIAQACKYLIETDWSISEVAYACGYKSVSNFNKLFKETKNCCPKAFRVQFDK